MTSETLTELWELAQRTQRHELEFWKKAEETLNSGLCTIEDIGTIYGIHPQTARKRLAALHYRRPQPDVEGQRQVGSVRVPNHIGVTKDGQLYNRS